jgi:molybdopterin converting factor small subunit
MARVSVKLMALLQRHLPPEARGRLPEAEVAAGETVGDLLGRLGIGKGSVHLVMVNGAREEWDAPLRDGDHVTVFPPVAGG